MRLGQSEIPAPTKAERAHALRDRPLDTGATSSAQDDIVVFVHTDEGITGVGETDVNPWIARACIEAPSTHTSPAPTYVLSPTR